MSQTCRIGIGGPVGSGKTALIEAITPRLLELGQKVLIITNDIVTTEDAKHVRKTLKGILHEDKIIGRNRSVSSHGSPGRSFHEYSGCGGDGRAFPRY